MLGVLIIRPGFLGGEDTDWKTPLFRLKGKRTAFWSEYRGLFCELDSDIRNGLHTHIDCKECSEDVPVIYGEYLGHISHNKPSSPVSSQIQLVSHSLKSSP